MRAPAGSTCEAGPADGDEPDATSATASAVESDPVPAQRPFRFTSRPRSRGFLLVLVAAVSLLSLNGCVVFEVSEQEPEVEPPEPAEPPDAGGERAIERAIFEMANEERRNRGLEPFAWDDQLAERARRWSREMDENERLEHQDLDAMRHAVDGYTGLGENIARLAGAARTGMVHVGWMRSEGHRANILRPGFDRLGVGVLCTDGELWVTQRFGGTPGSGNPSPDEDVPPEQPIAVDEGSGPACPSAAGGT